MKTKNLLVCAIFFIIIINGYSQDIIFSDTSLKSFLINENCVDIDNDNNPDMDADINDDGEIQLSEAENITNLIFHIFENNYSVESIQDLSNFSKLEKLTIIYFNDLENIYPLALDNLMDLWIGSCLSLKHIDLSDMHQLVNLKIEDIDSLDYLNLQNNNFPSGVFSLFYTENIQFACVDDINEEYNEVSYHMAQGVLPSINCPLGITEIDLENQIKIFPNPTSNFFSIIGNQIENSKIKIIDISGSVVGNFNDEIKNIDISILDSGIYFVKIYNQKHHITKKLIKL